MHQRLGLYGRLARKKGKARIWLHAASVGEVHAADILIAELRKEIPEAEYVVTTMTIHGRKLAVELLSDDVICKLAPLDVPGIAGRVISKIDPDVYVCLETELWPVLLRRLNNRSIPTLLANGRMSDKSVTSYQKHAWLFQKVVENFTVLTMISESDKERYVSLGIGPKEVIVTGNLKYDRELPESPTDVRDRCRKTLSIVEGTEVFVCGSTHTGEENILLPVYKALKLSGELVWIIAPRHLHRLEQVETMLMEHGVRFDRYSALKEGHVRQHDVVIVDLFGELFEIYSIADYIFCGGSLVERNGHNILEPAMWGRTVMYGPSMGDFRDAVEMMDLQEAGLPVTGGRAIFDKISYFRNHREEYQLLCQRAGQVAVSQQGAAKRQAGLVASLLHSS
ncbi:MULTISPECIES: 3-deoxy-D-manno-octulosonic acid transferase [Desulfosediminicola]|uniref:3-deoxy-D-manno-octulosonic acid transferase n=1 Tax=Desulfosediminicola TaxID=2886823 RepID=UPI00142EBC08|nr:glycosyltransferase N-terminal domain-containing protein [Desulfosediminicola ganghwensis]